MTAATATARSPSTSARYAPPPAPRPPSALEEEDEDEDDEGGGGAPTLSNVARFGLVAALGFGGGLLGIVAWTARRPRRSGSWRRKLLEGWLGQKIKQFVVEKGFSYLLVICMRETPAHTLTGRGAQPTFKHQRTTHAELLGLGLDTAAS